MLQACWHLVKVGAWLEESLPPNIRKTRGKGGMVRINQEEKKHNKGCEQQQSLHRSLKRAHDMDVFCQARHLSIVGFPPSGIFLCKNHPPFPSCTWRTIFSFHALSSFLLLLPLGNFHYCLHPITPRPTNIHTDHTKQHVQQKSGAQPQKTNQSRLQCSFHDVHNVWPWASD